MHAGSTYSAIIKDAVERALKVLVCDLPSAYATDNLLTLWVAVTQPLCGIKGGAIQGYSSRVPEYVFVVLRTVLRPLARLPSAFLLPTI